MKKLPLQRTTRVLFLFLLILALSNCATLSVSTETDSYRNKAMNYEKAEEFLKAIQMWKVVGSLSPADTETIKKIDDLQKQADSAAANHFKRGVTYYQKNAAASARKEFLLALFYNPDHHEARKKLNGYIPMQAP